MATGCWTALSWERSTKYLINLQLCKSLRGKCFQREARGGGQYLNWDVGGRHLGVLGYVGPLHRCVCRHILEENGNKFISCVNLHPEKNSNTKKKLKLKRHKPHNSYPGLSHSQILCTVLTVPLLPIERWLSCCVRGPIIDAGWMDMVWSIPGVRTAPYGGEHQESKLN